MCIKTPPLLPWMKICLTTQPIFQKHQKKNTSSSQTSENDVNNTSSNTESLGNKSEEPRATSKRYCHYFVNYGKCNYEEKSGNKCKFTHQTAPLCKSGINCSRLKCMFSHPKPQNQTSFLANQVPIIHPWQILPQIMTQPQHMMPSPWNQMQNQMSRQSFQHQWIRNKQDDHIVKR